MSCRGPARIKFCRRAGEEASPDNGDSRDRSARKIDLHGQRYMCEGSPRSVVDWIVQVYRWQWPGQTVQVRGIGLTLGWCAPGEAWAETCEREASRAASETAVRSPVPPAEVKASSSRQAG